MAVASSTAALIGAGAGLVGSGMSASAANKASSRAAAASSEQLALQKEERQRYLDIYGEPEENLGKFYSSLTPEQITATGLQAQAQEYQVAQQRLRENLAQRGLGGGGVEAAGLTSLETQRALQSAQVRQQAPFQLAQMQQGFVGLGKGTGGSDVSGIANTLGKQSAVQMGLAQQAQQSAESSLGAGLGYAADMYGRQQEQQFLTNLLSGQQKYNYLTDVLNKKIGL